MNNQMNLQINIKWSWDEIVQTMKLAILFKYYIYWILWLVKYFKILLIIPPSLSIQAFVLAFLPNNIIVHVHRHRLPGLGAEDLELHHLGAPAVSGMTHQLSTRPQTGAHYQELRMFTKKNARNMLSKSQSVSQIVVFVPAGVSLTGHHPRHPVATVTVR